MEEKHEKRLSSHINTVLSLAGKSDYSLARLVGDIEGVNYSSTVKCENECLAQLYMHYPMLPEQDWVRHCLEIIKCALTADIDLQTAAFTRFQVTRLGPCELLSSREALNVLPIPVTTIPNHNDRIQCQENVSPYIKNTVCSCLLSLQVALP